MSPEEMVVPLVGRHGGIANSDMRALHLMNMIVVDNDGGFGLIYLDDRSILDIVHRARELDASFQAIRAMDATRGST